MEPNWYGYLKLFYLMAATEEVPFKIPAKKIKSILQDEEKTARAAKLLYVSDSEEGIERRKKGKSFEYYYQDKILKDDEDLVRIKSLVIPPAWENVWICKKDNGHLQATGIDARGRKQYKYHPDWCRIRSQTKFYRMVEFGKTLPTIREELKKDLDQKELTLTKVLAACVSVIEKTGIRIGNAAYEKEYKSYGLTTLKNRHVDINGTRATFSFKGKKGVKQTLVLRNKKLAKIIKQCKEIPGKELFQFFDEDGKHHSIDSGMVNDYIKEISGADFTAKDFRTWEGTIHALLALSEMTWGESDTERKKQIVEAIDKVSGHLGNTRSVCRKYYIHPLLFSLYENRKLDKYLHKMKEKKDSPAIAAAEEMIMTVLEANPF